jgi:hypothetical protein
VCQLHWKTQLHKILKVLNFSRHFKCKYYWVVKFLNFKFIQLCQVWNNMWRSSLNNNFDNEEKSAASFCCQVAVRPWVTASVAEMFCNCHLMKNHKIAKNTTTAKDREKNSTYLKFLDFLCLLTKFINNQILLYKVSHRSLLKARLCTVWKSLIFQRLG